MFALSPATRVYLVAGITDMRKSFDTLHALVHSQVNVDPLSGHLFLFCNRRRDRLKILFWDGSGLWVCAKRLVAHYSHLPFSEDPLSVSPALR